MIDWDRVNELREEIGADDFGEVVEIFLEEVEEEINKLRDTPDSENLEAPLHFLKGSALNLGFATFSQLCQAGESAAANGAGGTIDLGEIMDCYDTSKAAFLSTLDNSAAA